jgi:hypothetical protein
MPVSSKSRLVRVSCSLKANAPIHLDVTQSMCRKEAWSLEQTRPLTPAL